MRHLNRLPPPIILVEKSTKWTSDFISSGKNRPDSNKYGHKEIRDKLNSISFYKCFYCETLLKDNPKEVDHHIEVSIDKTKAFEWNNLYLSCDNCNNKENHNSIPINLALDPCKNSDSEIEVNIMFEDEVIKPKNGSKLGLDTIQKYKLNTELLDKRRLNHLKNFIKLINAIEKNCRQTGRMNFNENEINVINNFMNLDEPYTLMIKNYLLNNPV